jgi:hypothetical protein
MEQKTMDNKALIESYMKYLEVIRQNDPKTVQLCWWHLHRLLSWADDTPFDQAKDITLHSLFIWPIHPLYILDAHYPPHLWTVFVYRSDRSSLGAGGRMKNDSKHLRQIGLNV